MKIYCLIFLQLFILLSCMDRAIDNRDLKIVNESNKIIYYFVSENDSFTKPYQDYSEYVLNTNNSISQDTFAYFIDKPINWEDFINNCKDRKMRLFIVLKDSVDKYGLKVVISKGIYTQKYFIDIDDLNNKNWSITYKEK
jgi:hypothetical protein